MTGYNPSEIRNLALVGHRGTGKTTFTEVILSEAGLISEPGSVDDGSAASDFTEEEQEKGYSIFNSYFNFSWKNTHFNLIDTPGYIDFRGEAASALSMVEGALIFVNADSGIEVNTDYSWKEASRRGVTRFVFINKLDKEDTDFGEIFDEINELSSQPLVPMTIPASDGEDYNGIIDILSRKLITEEGESEEIPEQYSDLVEEYRTNLVEAAVESDEELMMRYLEEEEISDDEITGALFDSVKEELAVPVFAGSALNNSGVIEAFDYVRKLLRSPAGQRGLETTSGEEVTIEADQDSELLAQVSKTMVDPYIGRLSIFKVYSGRINEDSELYVPRLGDQISTNKFYKLNGEEQEQVEELIAGDIGAVAKITELETSDTICSPDNDIELAEIELPEPMLIKKVVPIEGESEEKMSDAIQRYSQEDLTFKVEYNTETKELLVYSMGTVHLNVIKDICRRKFDVSFDTDNPSVAYKETIQTKSDVEYRHKKQSGGRGQFGHVMLLIEPLPRGEKYEFEEEIFGGAIPNQYIPGVEKGVKEAMEEGVLAGYPVVDCKTTVYDGDYHEVDSSEMAFKLAASKAFKQGMEDAKPVLLEPIMNVKITVPEEYMGDIMGDLNSRRGQIQGMDPQDGQQVIKAKVPQAEMFTYASDLKSLTGGYGNFSMEFSHYEKVPSELAEDIIARARREDED